MKKRRIGNTNLNVNEIGYGEMSLSIEAHRMSEESAIDFLQRAVDEHGVELIDTADAYCLNPDEFHHGERLLAKALRGERRQRVVIATKGGFIRTEGKWLPDGRPEHLRATCEESLRALESDRIDLYQFHRHDPNVPIEDSLGALRELQSEGKILHIGVSNFKLAQLELARTVVDVVSLQNPLSFLFYSPELAELVKYCEKNSITWLAYAPVGGHRNAHNLVEYTPWKKAHLESTESIYTLALAWLLQLSNSIIPIPATTKPGHLLQNMKAADVRLSDKDFQAMHSPKSWRESYADAMKNEDRHAAINTLLECLTFRSNEPLLYYDLACHYAVTGQTHEALDALEKSIRHGFQDRKVLDEDSDFENIRTEARFEVLRSGMTATV